MPNWCHNRLSVYCSDENEFKRLRADILTQGELTFTKLLPVPSILRDISSGFVEIDGQKHTNFHLSDDGTPTLIPPDILTEVERRFAPDERNWYDWCVKHWGTKWDASATDIHEDDGVACLHIEYETAWSPPDGFIKALRAKYPKVDITAFFDEPNMQVAGYL